MNGKEILVDTNILLYLLSGNDTLEVMLQGKILHVSFLTELELIGYKNITAREEKKLIQLLNDCEIVTLSPEVKLMYVALRKKYHLKLVDAVIAATSIALELPLITADKQFSTVKELQLLQYSK